jgi:ABC-type uncharacterized transport system involved in gliding motility auxiliary subunit
LKNSDVPVTVKLFVSPDEDIPSQNQNWLVMLRDLRSRLEVLKSFAGKNLKIEVARPRTDSDDEDSAKQAGVNPQQMPNGENIFFGLAATCLDKTSVIPFVPAIDAPMMEHKLVRAISRVVPNSRKTVGLMSALELDGGQMAMMGGPPASFFYRELSEDYDVVKVEVTANEIKTEEYNEYTLDFALGNFTRQETKNGNPGTKGSGPFTIQDVADPKNGGKAPDKIEFTKYRINEGGSMSDLTFSGPSTGSQLTNMKTEGFAYTYEKTDETHAKIKVSKGIDVLVVVHPAGITDEAQWAIDQFILKGGKVLAMVDSYNIQAAESARQQQNPMMGGRPPVIPTFSGLDKLTTTWGYSFDSTKSVADVNYAAPMFGNNPLIITPPTSAISKDNLVTKGLSDFVFAFAGGFSGKAGFNLQEEVLIQTSAQTQMVSTDNLNRGAIDKIKKDFTSSDQKKILALKVSGMFPTSFPQGKPDAPPPAPPRQPGMGGMGGMPFNFGGQGDPGPAGEPAPGTAAPAPAPAPTAATPPVTITPSPAPEAPPAGAPPAITPAAPAAGTPPATPPAVPGAPPAAPAPPAKPKVPSLTVADKAGTVYLVADADLLYDPVSLEQNRGPLAEPANANLPFIMNIIDDLAGNGGLIQARSRSSASRPFTKLNEILEETNKGLRKEQAEVEKEIEDWKKEITSAAGKRQGNSPFIMVDQRQLDELNKKVEQGEAKKRELRKAFRKNIENKFFSYHWMNILGVPILTILIGFAIVLFVKQSTAAR